MASPPTATMSTPTVPVEATHDAAAPTTAAAGRVKLQASTDALARRLAQPWYQTKTEPSFEDMITKLRKTLIVARFTPASPGQPNPVPQPPRSSETRGLLTVP